MKIKSAYLILLFGLLNMGMKATANDSFLWPLPSDVSRTLLFGTPLRSIFGDVGLSRNPEQQNNNEQLELYSQAMELFITKIYNAPGYAQHISQDGTHVTEFMSLAQDFSLNIEAVYTGLRLFYNKYKEAEIIDDTTVTQILDELPNALAPWFPFIKAHHSEHTTPAKVIENILLIQFTENLPRTQLPTDIFLRDLSEKIASFMSENSPEQVDAMRERLRNLVIQFIELLFSKMMWYPTAYENIWQSVISCAHNIHLLGANQIINHLDDVDNLLWTLVHRFRFFLEQCGSTLPDSVFKEIRYDLENELVSFLEAPELDAGITSKKEVILTALAMAEIRSVAYQKHGIISDEIIVD